MEIIKKSLIINNYDGFIFDLDGTIYLDDKLIPNADLVVKKIKDSGKKVVFISNKTTGSIRDYFEFLQKKGLEVQEDEIVNATVVIKKYLSNNHKGQNFFAIGEEPFIKEIKQASLNFVVEPDEIDIVLITLDRTLDYNKLEIAAKALDSGANFYAANIDNTCPVLGGEILDAGSTISALEKRTHRKLEKHFGKPSKFMMDEITSLLNLPPERCLIVGDRIETDIAMGNNFGVDTALVSTGVIKDQFTSGQYTPTFRIESIFDLVKKTQ